MNKWVVMLCVFIPAVVQAEQRLVVREGGNVTANIAASALSRIAVQGDRISSIKGNAGQFQLEKDLNLGQIFIQPISPEDKTPIHVYISTEQGHTYSLTLLSNDMPAENIILVSTSTQTGLMNWDKAAPYETAIVSIIKSMHNQSVLEGYSILETTKNNYKIKCLSIKNKDRYQGDKLQGASFEVENSSDQEIYLKESDFYRQGIRAISILNKNLSPQGKTTVYTVSGV